MRLINRDLISNFDRIQHFEIDFNPSDQMSAVLETNVKSLKVKL